MRRSTRLTIHAESPNEHKRTRKPDAPNGWMRDKYDNISRTGAPGSRRSAWRSGQATLQMAQNYTHLAAERVREHVAKLPALGPIAPAAVTSLDEARKQRVHTRGRSANNGAEATAKS